MIRLTTASSLKSLRLWHSSERRVNLWHSSWMIKISKNFKFLRIWDPSEGSSILNQPLTLFSREGSNSRESSFHWSHNWKGERFKVGNTPQRNSCGSTCAATMVAEHNFIVAKFRKHKQLLTNTWHVWSSSALIRRLDVLASGCNAKCWNYVHKNGISAMFRSAKWQPKAVQVFEMTCLPSEHKGRINLRLVDKTASSNTIFVVETMWARWLWRILQTGLDNLP